MESMADLMLLHPNGKEEVLVSGGAGSVTDPMVSFDGAWVYYSLLHDLTGFEVARKSIKAARAKLAAVRATPVCVALPFRRPLQRLRN
jgi:hypothetical protein